MNLGVLILLGLIVGEVVTAVKLSKQARRIDKLVEESAKQKRKES